MNIDEFYGAAQKCIGEFNEFVEKHELQQRSQVDHLCYKCSTSKEFEHMRHILEQASKFLYQSIISQRRIAIIKLEQPIPTLVGSLDTIELSDQKKDNSQGSGFDHVEIIPNNSTYENLVTFLLKKNVNLIEVQRPITPHTI